MKAINLLNLFVAVLLLICAIFNFINGNIAIGIFDLAVFCINVFAFLVTLALWWEKSKKVQQKFKFTCKHCGNKFVPNFWRWFLVPHIGSRRYFKCDNCKVLSWMRRK